MRRMWIHLFWLWPATLFGFQDEPDLRPRVSGWIGAQLLEAEGTTTWLEGGFGKLQGDAIQGTNAALRGHLAITWQPSLYFKAYVHGLARSEREEVAGESWGVTEAYLQTGLFLGRGGRLRLRGGMMFPQTSMEHIDPLWTSPYTLTFSALNTWIGEEVRTTGLDLNYHVDVSETTALFAGAAALRDNDTIGAALAWRGFSLGNRLTVRDEVLPLPPLPSLSDTGPFGVQRDDGTRPLGTDLDDKTGWRARIGAEWNGRLLVQYSRLDNRADRQLYRGEYAWETDFDQVGISWDFGSNAVWTFAGEWLDGHTGMGFRRSPNVQISFLAWYGLLSVADAEDRWRLTARYDRFETEDLDVRLASSNADLNQEDGRAWTLALFWQPARHWRIGAEFVTGEANRAAAPDLDLDPESLQLEARYRW
ncbi:hypothetical protein SCOR_10995 [Sulfidibacter corallicola]|uniref:Uncharacterized protein n=1 Tax=Sulfidibacter corallicola TaxID=2818388 RepID=A0A8A4TF21_SULCO|nr:OprO/OprP family phosphate-selective porin [Sulfidibacter corallicola]QTD48137.1 hypothetical protein J3U87_21335 [Sulfidibacter corallicola]